MSTDTKSGRIAYYDVLRILAMFAVIVTHVSATYWYTSDIRGSDWLAMNIWDSVFFWAVSIFIMISGALLLDPTKDIQYPRFIKKNVCRIVLGFLVWSFIYAVYVLKSSPDINGGTAFSIQFIAGHYHLWYIFMILGLYLLLPILRLMTPNRKITRYFLLLSFVFTFFVPTIRELSTQFFKITGASTASTLTNAMFSAWTDINFFYTLGYVPHFVLGYYLSTAALGKKMRIAIYTLGLLSFFAAPYLSWKIALAIDTRYSFFGHTYLVTLFQAVAIFVSVKQLSQRFAFSRIKWLKYVSDRCFLIYLMHALVLEVLDKYFQVNSLLFGIPIIMIPLLSIAVFLICLFFSAGIHLIGSRLRRLFFCKTQKHRSV